MTHAWIGPAVVGAGVSWGVLWTGMYVRSWTRTVRRHSR